MVTKAPAIAIDELLDGLEDHCASVTVDLYQIELLLGLDARTLSVEQYDRLVSILAKVGRLGWRIMQRDLERTFPGPELRDLERANLRPEPGP